MLAFVLIASLENARHSTCCILVLPLIALRAGVLLLLLGVGRSKAETPPFRRAQPVAGAFTSWCPFSAYSDPVHGRLSVDSSCSASWSGQLKSHHTAGTGISGVLPPLQTMENGCCSHLLWAGHHAR